jgi:hypothetical protein
MLSSEQILKGGCDQLVCDRFWSQRLPNQLPDIGGRILVETKDSVLPFLGVAPLTPVAAIKHALQGLTAIPVSQELLSSVGCVMHDGLNTLYQDSILDLSKSGKFTLPEFLYILDR